MKLNVVLIR